MEKKLIMIVSVVVAIASLVMAATAYIMVTGVGNCPCLRIEGKLSQIYISQDEKTVKFIISLTAPYKVKNWDHIRIYLNVSDDLIKLNYNSTNRIWEESTYTAKISDANLNGAMDSGDYLILQSQKFRFNEGDSVHLSVLVYRGELSAQIHPS